MSAAVPVLVGSWRESAFIIFQWIKEQNQPSLVREMFWNFDQIFQLSDQKFLFQCLFFYSPSFIVIDNTKSGSDGALNYNKIH